LETAIEHYQKALSLNPEYAEVYKHLGNVFVKQSKLEEAVDYFQKAIAIKPDYADAHFGKAFVLLKSGNFAQGWQEHTWRRSRVTYLEALNLNPMETEIPLFPNNLA
jgi:tetratricopeptide (TPR) repeat protein